MEAEKPEITNEEITLPAVVNHDSRRLEIAAAVGRLVARSGIQSVTIRAVAKEAGYSSAILGHYFHNKEDLLSFTYLSARHRTVSRVERALLAGKGVFHCLKECLPTNTDQRIDWMLWFGFWGMATGNQALVEERGRGLTEANMLFQRILMAAKARGELPESIDCESQAVRMAIFINGIASLTVQMPESWPAGLQESLLKAEIESLQQPTTAGVPSLDCS